MHLLNLFDSSLIGRSELAGLEILSGPSRVETYSFGELEIQSNQLAHFFQSQGFAQGDRLCTYLPNGLGLILVYLACVKLGVIFVPINILYKEREIAGILDDAEPLKTIVTRPISIQAAAWELEWLESEFARMPSYRPQLRLDGNAPAAMIYTSGTTGAPKGAVLRHDNFASNAISLSTHWQIDASDRFLHCLPLSHVHGLGNGLHCWLLSGCKLRLWEKFEADTAESVFLDFRPTLFFGVPTIYVRLLKLENDVCRQIGLRMRLFVSGSAPLPLEVFKDFQKKFGHTILERYGMTETLMNTSNPYLGERIGGTVGQALPDVEIKLLNELGVEVGDNEVGEIHVRGPNVFPGYWRKPEATHNAFVDGYFRTGDLAKKSPDGYYSICGRKKDLIISSGFNIYPREIEEFLERQSGIAEAAVVGIIDTVRGEVPIAFVVPSESFDPAKIKEICRQNLASFKIPQRFITVSQLPRNALGKIQKQLLLETESPWGNPFSVD